VLSCKFVEQLFGEVPRVGCPQRNRVAPERRAHPGLPADLPHDSGCHAGGGMARESASEKTKAQENRFRRWPSKRLSPALEDN